MNGDEKILSFIQSEYSIRKFEISFGMQITLAAITKDDERIVFSGESITDVALKVLCKLNQK